MTDCTNDTTRDLLPLLAHDALAADEAARARAHVAACASCTAELSALTTARGLFAAATPALDHAAILARIPAPAGAPHERGEAAPSRPVLSLSRRTPRVLGLPRYALAAAASLVLVAALSLTMLRSTFFDGQPNGVAVVDAANPFATGGAVPVDLLGASALGELDTDQLELLLAELDAMEATIDAEPLTIRQALVAAPEEGI